MRSVVMWAGHTERMADVLLDTPIAAFGIASGLMFDHRPVAAYIRLSPLAPSAPAWWRGRDVVQVELPPLPGEVARAGSTWSVPPSFLLAGPDGACGLLTGQQGVNGAYVRELAQHLVPGSKVEPWPALCLVRIGKGLWIVDGNHRASAAVLAGRPTHRAYVADIDELGSCPCGWDGPGGTWLTHPCAELTVSA